MTDQFAVGIDLGGTKIYGALVNAQGAIIHEMQESTEDPVPQIVALVEALSAAADGVVSAVGVGVPGMTSDDGEAVVAAPAVGWTDFPLKSRLQQHLTHKIALENDVNLAAWGEYQYGAGKGTSSLVCVAVGTGIGAGIVLNGKLYRGRNASAGEVGYLLPSIDVLPNTYSDGFGALEQIASGTGIAERARLHLRKVGNFHLAQSVTAADVLEAASRQETWAVQLVAETVDYLTLAIANISAVLDPECIVMTGGVMASPAVFITPISERLTRLLPFAPRLVPSALGVKAAALGAAAYASMAG